VPGQQVYGRDLARGVDCGQVPGESAGDREPLAPRVRVRIHGDPRPGERQLGGDPLRACPFEELDEPFEKPPVLGHREPEPAPDPQIVLQRRMRSKAYTPE